MSTACIRGQTEPFVVRTKRLDGLPVISIRLWLRGGSREEEIPGLALITGRMLAEGTRQRSWSRLATEIESDGIVLQCFGSSETIGVAVDALAADWRKAIELVDELINEPIFPADRLGLMCQQAAAELESSFDRPEVRTARAFLGQIYGDHPYSRPLQGSARHLASLGREDCGRFIAASRRRGIVAVATGDIDEAAIRESLEASLAGVSGSPAEPEAKPPLPIDSIPRPAASRCEVDLPGAEQAQILAGQLTVPRTHPDLAALEVAAIALGAGPGTVGRLPDRIREREGLAYSADFSIAGGAGIDAGRMVAYAGVATANLDRAERAIREELERFLDQGIGQDELEAARSYLLGRDPFRRETPGQWANLLGESELYGIDVADPGWAASKLLPLTKDDVDEAARRWIDPSRLAVTVGFPRGIPS